MDVDLERQDGRTAVLPEPERGGSAREPVGGPGPIAGGILERRAERGGFVLVGAGPGTHVYRHIAARQYGDPSASRCRVEGPEESQVDRPRRIDRLPAGQVDRELVILLRKGRQPDVQDPRTARRGQVTIRVIDDILRPDRLQLQTLGKADGQVEEPAVSGLKAEPGVDARLPGVERDRRPCVGPDQGGRDVDAEPELERLIGDAVSTANANILLPCATLSTASQIIIPAGIRNVALRGCALRGASNASGSQGGTVFLYSGAGAMIEIGDPTYAADTLGFHLDNVVINTTSASNSTTQALVAYRAQEMDLQSLYLLGNSNQTGMTLDGTGNYTGGTFYDNAINGFQTAVNAIGHQIDNPATTDWLNASTFVRLHIDCPTIERQPHRRHHGHQSATGRRQHLHRRGC